MTTFMLHSLAVIHYTFYVNPIGNLTHIHYTLWIPSVTLMHTYGSIQVVHCYYMLTPMLAEC